MCVLFVHLQVIFTVQGRETRPIVEVPDLDGAVTGARDQSSTGGIESHGSDLLVAVAVGKLDGFLSCVNVPHTHHRAIASTNNLR